MRWFKRHPDFLKSESTALSNDSNYHELHQSRASLFLSHGNIIVRLDKVYEHPVLFVYTDATPYQLPIILPLTQELDDMMVDLLATMTIGQLFAHVKPYIKYHHLRHQNSDGVLCVVEWESLEQGGTYYGITSVLSRLRDWFAGLVTGEFPLDNGEIEFCAHFRHVDKNTTMLYPDEFVTPGMREGEFYSVLVKKILDVGVVHVGCLIDGISANGLIENQPYLFPQWLDEKLKTSYDFQQNQELVEKFITDRKLMHGFWFEIDVPLEPFESFKSLIELIGHGNYDEGVKRVSSVGQLYFSKHAPDELIIGIRYPNYRDVREFQVFRVHKAANPSPIDVGAKPFEKMISIVNRYDKVEAVECERFSRESYYMRNSTRASYEVLEEKIVNVLGTGALGSEIADVLNKAGVKLALFDRQNMSALNPVRHLVGVKYVGINKVHAVKDILQDHNPFNFIDVAHMDLYSPGLVGEFPPDSWSVSSVADDNLEGYLNEQAVIANRPLFYVRALRGGKVGRIFRVIPGKDACIECLNLYQKDNTAGKKNDFISIPEDSDYPTLFNECNNPVRPASAADLKIISSLAARIILDQLQHEDLEHNHFIWSTEVLTGTPITVPYQVHRQTLKPHPQCYYCNHGDPIKLTVVEKTLKSMQKMVAEREGIETGGVLAGMRQPDGSIHLTHASGPGPKAIHEPTRFEKDVEFCQKFLDKLYMETSGEVVYMGEWHSHPNSDNRPSGLDLRSLSEISEQQEYLTENPVMIIFSSKGQPSCSVHPAGKGHYFTELLILKA